MAGMLLVSIIAVKAAVLQRRSVCPLRYILLPHKANCLTVFQVLSNPIAINFLSTFDREADVAIGIAPSNTCKQAKHYCTTHCSTP
jgi:hypothetical protein